MVGETIRALVSEVRGWNGLASNFQFPTWIAKVLHQRVIEMKRLGDVLKETEIGSKYLRHEFQDYGLRLAEVLGDLKHKSLYIKLAKEEKRELLQQVLDFVKDSKPRNKARLFMWKLKIIRGQKAEDGKRMADL